jgi:hypothetical protein
MADRAAPHPEPHDPRAFEAAVEKAKDTVRELARWIVGGVALAAGGVIGGASLTSVGSLGWAWRLQLAGGAAIVGLLLLGCLMWVALDVIAPRSYSLNDIAKGVDILPRRLKVIEARVKDLYPDGIQTLAQFVEVRTALNHVAREPWAPPEVTETAEEYRNKATLIRISLTYEHLLLLFRRLKFWLFLLTAFIAIAFGIFAWAANPPKDTTKCAGDAAIAPELAGALAPTRAYSSVGGEVITRNTRSANPEL